MPTTARRIRELLLAADGVQAQRVALEAAAQVGRARIVSVALLALAFVVLADLVRQRRRSAQAAAS